MPIKWAGEWAFAQAFLGEGDALVYAQIPDSTEYDDPDFQVAPRVVDLDNNTEFLLNDSMMPREPGVFNSPLHKVYYFDATLDPEHTYAVRMKVRGNDVSAETPIVNPPAYQSGFLQTNSNSKLNLMLGNQYNTVDMDFRSGRDARRYDVSYRVRYAEDRSGVLTEESYTVFLGSVRTNGLNGGEELQVAFSGEALPEHGQRGINLNLGFGPQPTAVIVNAVNNASCLTTCGTTCDAPGTLTVTNIFLTGALLGWMAIGVTNYDLQWRQVGSSTLNTVTGITGNSYQLNGLVQGTNYEFQVRSNCSGISSGYSTVRTSTTPIPCPDTLEPNNSVAIAALVTLPAQVTALIATNTDADYYRFTISATSTINLSLSGMPYDYDLRLLNSAGTQVASCTAGGTTAEFINYTNAAPGTYYAHVFGFSGVFDPNVCYSLFVSSFVTACAIPQGVAVNTITYNSANVTWTTAQSASSYDLRWKAVAHVDWTTETGVTAPPYTLNGLMELTDYQVQVRAICGSAGGTQGGSTSEYGELIPFTTLETPCEVAPRIQVGISVWLDGPYDMVTGLMHDSLRTQGLLPMSEPYTALGYTVSGAASISGQLLATTGPGAPVDWVLLELRSPNAPFNIVETRAALIRRDGALMAPDGGQFIRFCTQGGMYRLAVRHRNHLGCMTAGPLSLGPLPTLFSMGSSTTFGEQAMRTTDGVSRMWAGNALNDGTILYTGGTNDRDAVLVAIGGSIPTNTVPGYRVEDVNLDGVVKYSGTNNDRDVILSTIGGIVPTNSVGCPRRLN